MNNVIVFTRLNPQPTEIERDWAISRMRQALDRFTIRARWITLLGWLVGLAQGVVISWWVW